MYNPDFLKNGRERTADSRFVVQNEDNGTIAGNFIDNGRLRNFLIPDEKRMVHSARFELTTYCSGGNRSIQLSYECGKIQYYTAFDVSQSRFLLFSEFFLLLNGKNGTGPPVFSGPVTGKQIISVYPLHRQI